MPDRHLTHLLAYWLLCLQYYRTMWTFYVRNLMTVFLPFIFLATLNISIVRHLRRTAQANRLARQARQPTRTRLPVYTSLMWPGPMWPLSPFICQLTLLSPHPLCSKLRAGEAKRGLLMKLCVYPFHRDVLMGRAGRDGSAGDRRPSGTQPPVRLRFPHLFPHHHYTLTVILAIISIRHKYRCMKLA